MAWYFLIPLGIALVVNYILKHSTDEIAYIATAILVVSLIISLMIAPWQLQLLLLILVSIGNLRIWQYNESGIDDLLEEQPRIELSYRGINYQVPHQSELAADESQNESQDESKIIGKYRGQVLKTHPAKPSQLSTEEQPNFEIKYRGIKVKRHQSASTEAIDNSSLNFPSIDPEQQIAQS